MPPEWMWPLPWEMEKALERVNRKRKERFGGNRSNGDSWDDDDGERKIGRPRLPTAADMPEPPPPRPEAANGFFADAMASLTG